MIYLDNAATTVRKPDEVVRAVAEAMNSLGNAGRGTHSATLSASRTVYDTREKLAKFFNAENASSIAFTMNSTQALNIAIKGILSPGDHVITSMMEHNAVLRPLYQMQDAGVKLTIVGADRRGNISYDDFAKAIRPDTRAIVSTHASNLTGNMVDIARLGKIAHENGALFIVDASQTAGVFPIDVQKMNIDILCFTGHKSLLGPQGTGGLYVKPGTQIKAYLSGGTGIQTYSHYMPEEMPVHLEAGTLNGHGIAGLNAAVDYLNREGIDSIRQKEIMLMERFYRGMLKIPEVKVYGDFSTMNRCPIVCINIGDYDSGEVSDELFERFDIATRPGGHCAPLMHEALGNREQGAVRFSFSHYNTEEEIDAAVRAVRILAEE